MSNVAPKPVMPPRSPFVTELLAEMQSETDAELLRLLRAGEPNAVANTVKQHLVPLSAALTPRLGD